MSKKRKPKGKREKGTNEFPQQGHEEVARGRRMKSRFTLLCVHENKGGGQHGRREHPNSYLT